jgi:outer membrane lipoprotein-sorting protein
MRRAWSCFLILALLPAAGAVAADLTADQVIAKHIAASGGYGKIKAIQTLKGTGMYSAGSAPIPFVTLRQRPNRYRWDRDIDGKKLVLSYDGQTAWWINPFGGPDGPAKMPDTDARNLMGESVFEDALIDYKQKGHQVELLDLEDVDGRQAYRLKVTRKDGGVERFFIDADNFLKTKHSFVFTANDREFEMLTFYQNYKAVSGVLLPHRIEREFAGQQRLIEFTSIEVNPKLDPTVFSMPKTTTGGAK